MRNIRHELLVVIVTLGLIAGHPAADRANAGKDKLNFFGGPTMLTPLSVFLVYWLPKGVVFDKTVKDGVGNYESLIERFFTDLPGTTYFNILTQYPGTVAQSQYPTVSRAGCFLNQCVVQNDRKAIRVRRWVDTKKYPHAGTKADPLQASDIQQEVKDAIAHGKGWSNVPLRAIYMIFTGADIEECRGASGCTFKPSGSSRTVFGGYHSHFGSASSPIIFAYLSAPRSGFIKAGGKGITPPNGQLASDLEVPVVSHEFFEAVTDPLLPAARAWRDKDAKGDDEQTGEIADLCQGTGRGTVKLNGHSYLVAQQLSNASSSCVTTYTAKSRSPK